MMSAAKNVAIFVEVDEIDEKFVAGVADETRRMPAGAGPRARRPHRDIAPADAVAAVHAARS